MPFGGWEEKGSKEVARGEEAWKEIQKHHRAKFLSEDSATNQNSPSPQLTPTLPSSNTPVR